MTKYKIELLVWASYDHKKIYRYIFVVNQITTPLPDVLQLEIQRPSKSILNGRTSINEDFFLKFVVLYQLQPLQYQVQVYVSVILFACDWWESGSPSRPFQGKFEIAKFTKYLLVGTCLPQF